MTAIRVYYIFFISFFKRLLRVGGRESLAIDCLINFHSYRIPSEKRGKDLILPFRYYWRSVKYIFQQGDRTESNGAYDKGFYCLHEYNASFFTRYFQFLNILNKPVLVMRRDLPRVQDLGIADQIVLLVLNFFLSSFLFFIGIFKRKNGNISLFTQELSEAVCLISSCQKHQVEYVYYFSAYEKDANWIALLLSKYGVFCHKVPSSNPLKNFYGRVIADKFSFTAPFQKNEYKHLARNWFVGEFEQLPVVSAGLLSEYTLENAGPPEQGTIGVFTRGIWLRKLRGDNFLGVGEDRAEELMLEYLKEYFETRNWVKKIYVLPHPTERKSNDLLIKTKAYYENLFGAGKFEFIISDQPNYSSFGKYSIGIASVSSVIFERLYCGYKCVLAPVDITVELYEDRNLDNIIAKGRNELFALLDDIRDMGEAAYFEKFGLSEYRLTKAIQLTRADLESQLNPTPVAAYSA